MCTGKNPQAPEQGKYVPEAFHELSRPRAARRAEGPGLGVRTMNDSDGMSPRRCGMVASRSAGPVRFRFSIMVLLLLQRPPVGGAAQVTGQLPRSPRCILVPGVLACSAADGALSTLRQGPGNSRRESATQERAGGIFRTAVELAESGLVGVERTPGIRRTATKKGSVEDELGPGRAGALRRRHLTLDSRPRQRMSSKSVTPSYVLPQPDGNASPQRTEESA